MAAKPLVTEQKTDLTDRVSVAVMRSDKQLLRQAAYLSDESVSAFIRAAALKSAARVVASERKAA